MEQPGDAKDKSKDLPPPFGSGNGDSKRDGPGRVSEVPLGRDDVEPGGGSGSGSGGEGGMIMGPDHPIFQRETTSSSAAGKPPPSILPP